MTPLDSVDELETRAIDATPVDELALSHLLLHLGPINRALKAAAEQRAGATARLMRPELRHACITEQHVQHLFEVADHLVAGARQIGGDFALTPKEARREESLRRTAEEKGRSLPIDAMTRALDLSPFEVHAVLMCAAPQLDATYQRIYAYVHDDLNRLGPSLELMSGLGAADLAQRIAQRAALARHGRLCRFGLLHAMAEPANPLHREYVLDAAAFNGLSLRDCDWAGLFRDSELVDTGDALALELFADCKALGRIACMLKSDAPCLVGLWGNGHYGVADAAIALAAASGRMLRHLPAGALDDATLQRSLRTARALGALLWVDTDALPERGQESSGHADRLAEQFARHAPALICTGVQPWRPLELLAQRALVDLHLSAPGPRERAAMWQAVAGDAEPATCRLLAERYRFSPREMRAATASARLRARMRSNGAATALADTLPQACRAISLRRAAQFAKVVVPRRQPADLILPPELHRRVLEVAAFYLASSRVDEGWGFGRLLTGGGLKVLLTGDSGTGKTAAAEVIASQVDRDQLMLKVHLASVVSKWVGETEKNLDAVFEHAEESHAVLFFDEADALFAKRGEVERGADRYANLEVGFLLQRLEDFSGLAILASNHKDQIDEAFMRRFHVVLHFPRPTVAERRRLWRLALPADRPQTGDIDLDLLQQLDLTGAGIVNAARMAALLAAQPKEGAAIGMAHLVQAVARQFQHEARLLPPAQLGRYAELAASAS
jgi:hypothetical protein